MSRRSGLEAAAWLLAAALLGCSEPALPPAEQPTKLVYANPGWTPRDRQIYYYTPQGTELHGLRYRWFQELELAGSRKKLADPELLSGFGFILDPEAHPEANPGGLPIGLTSHVDPEGGDALLDIACAACHTGELHYRGTAIRIDGGQAMHAVASTADLRSDFGPTLVAAMAQTYLWPPKFDRFAKEVLGVEYPQGKDELRQDFGRVLGKFVREAVNGRDLYPTADGYGRIDALGHIANAVFGDGLDPRNYTVANAPVNYPHVWDIWKFDWVQWNGSVAQPMGRNAGEALGVKAPLTLVGKYGSTLPPYERYQSGVLVRELHCVESTLWHLQPPVWPEEVLGPIDETKAEKGARLFGDFCQGCHGPHLYPPADQPTPGKPFEWRVALMPTHSIGTDPLTASNFVDRRNYDASTVDPDLPKLAAVSAGAALDVVTLGVIERKYRELGIERDGEERFWLDGFGRQTQVQEKRTYKARPLHGIWATPPFLHNGSVPTLYDMLLPEEERPETFWVGTREFDPQRVGYETGELENGFLFDTGIDGNANTGHQFRHDGGTGVIYRGKVNGKNFLYDENGKLRLDALDREDLAALYDAERFVLSKSDPRYVTFTDQARYEIIEYLKVLGNPNYPVWQNEADPRPVWRDPKRREGAADRYSPDRYEAKTPDWAELQGYVEDAAEYPRRPWSEPWLPAPQCPPQQVQGPAALPTTAWSRTQREQDPWKQQAVR